MKDALETVGRLITGKEPRDAVHVAIAPVTAAEKLDPGQHVGFAFPHDQGHVSSTPHTVTIGIIDPYLADPVKKGESCWLFLYPRTITSLQHKWEHPDFPSEEPITPEYVAAREFLEDLAPKLSCNSYEELMEGAADWIACGDYMSDGPRFEGSWVDEDFWDAFETVTGTRVPESKRESFFSCSC